MRRNRCYLALVLAGSLVYCTRAPMADSSPVSRWPEPTESQLKLYYEAYDHFLETTFPLEAAAYLSVQIYKDMPSSTPEDLEFSFSMTRPYLSDPVRVRVLAADQAPVVEQVFELATRSGLTRTDEILSRLRLVDRQLDIASCPAIQGIQETWQPHWLQTPLPVPSEELIVTLHPRVVRISVQADSRAVTLETRDPEDPPFRWGIEAASELRSCVIQSLGPLPTFDLDQVKALCNHGGGCAVAKKVSARLPEFESCVLGALAARCTLRDQCIVECFAIASEPLDFSNCFSDCASVFVRVDGVPTVCPQEPAPPGYDGCDP
jgi:hypothetical protein